MLNIDDIDARKFPTAEQIEQARKLDGANTISLEDLHANTLKLIWALTVFEIWNIKEDDFNALSKMYQREDNSWGPKDFLEFANIIFRQKFNKNTLVKLLEFKGDILADRGKHDLFTMITFVWLWQQTNKHDFLYIILLSNHDIQFINNTIKSRGPTKIYFSEQDSSWQGLKKSIKNNHISSKWARAFLHVCYIPYLRTLAYWEDKNSVNSSHHAPASTENIQLIVKQFLKKELGEFSNWSEILNVDLQFAWHKELSAAIKEGRTKTLWHYTRRLSSNFLESRTQRLVADLDTAKVLREKNLA